MNPIDNMSEKICKNVGKNMPAIFLPAEQLCHLFCETFLNGNRMEPAITFLL